jgi:hypothetical protein
MFIGHRISSYRPKKLHGPSAAHKTEDNVPAGKLYKKYGGKKFVLHP